MVSGQEGTQRKPSQSSQPLYTRNGLRRLEGAGEGADEDGCEDALGGVPVLAEDEEEEGDGDGAEESGDEHGGVLRIDARG